MKAIQLVPAMEEGGVERYTVLLNRILTEGGWENLVISAGGKLAAEIERDGGRHRVLDLKSKNPLTYFLRAAKRAGMAARLGESGVARALDDVCAWGEFDFPLFACHGSWRTDNVPFNLHCGLFDFRLWNLGGEAAHCATRGGFDEV